MPKAAPNNLLNCCIALGVVFTLFQSAAHARSITTDAQNAIQAFATHCFSPFLTGAKIATTLQFANNRVDFYDLDPFSNAEPTPATGAAPTPGTDRRCEVAIYGDFTSLAVKTVRKALVREGITTKVAVPGMYIPSDGTVLLAARQLNPKRVAVVHIGTRPGPNATAETFMTVERLVPTKADR